MIKICCTYCWTSHYTDSLDWWINNNKIGCGADKARYFFNSADYIAYVRQYEANGNKHPEPALETLPLFEMLTK